jgi:hypothetical protein
VWGLGPVYSFVSGVLNGRRIFKGASKAESPAMAWAIEKVPIKYLEVGGNGSFIGPQSSNVGMTHV